MATPRVPSLRAFPSPGRFALRGEMPGAEPALLAAAGRHALGALRRRLLREKPSRGLPRLLARLQGPDGADLTSQALHAARLAGAAPHQGRLRVVLNLAGAEGRSASLAWQWDGTEESLRWSLRGAQAEDGACQGSAAVAAALER